MRDAKRPVHPVLDGLKQGVVFGAAVAAVLLPPLGGARTAPARPLVAAAATAPAAPRIPRVADFAGETPPATVRQVADWATDARNNGPLHFVIVDKRDARIWVFSPEGRLIAQTPVLLGAAAGDDSVVGIGQRPIAEVRPEERTTPAGRFIAEPGRNAHQEDVVWVDYDAAVSMHRLRAVEASERRHERLATPTSEDNRISYGCINVPPEFFDAVVKPAFDGRRGVVYVLPEVKTVPEAFAGWYDVAARGG
jgi:hypothetical protein